MLARYEEGSRRPPRPRAQHARAGSRSDGRLVGFISLRHELNDFLLEQGGHIGYAVRPADRGRGLATAATALMLQECRRRGIDPVLITCDEDNAASAAVIERNGGVLEDVRHGKRRYWVPSRRLNAPPRGSWRHLMGWGHGHHRLPRTGRRAHPRGVCPSSASAPGRSATPTPPRRSRRRWRSGTATSTRRPATTTRPAWAEPSPPRACRGSRSSSRPSCPPTTPVVSAAPSRRASPSWGSTTSTSGSCTGRRTGRRRPRCGRRSSAPSRTASPRRSG